MDYKVAFEQIHEHLGRATRLGKEGFLDEAIAELERAAEIAQSGGKLGAAILPDILSNLSAFKSKAADSNVRLAAMNNHAAALHQRGDYEGAHRAFRDVVERIRGGSPLNEVDLARALSNLSVASTELGLDDEAQQHSREAYEVLMAAAKQTDPIMTAVLHNWAIRTRRQEDGRRRSTASLPLAAY